MSFPNERIGEKRNGQTVNDTENGNGRSVSLFSTIFFFLIIWMVYVYEIIVFWFPY